MDYNLYLNDTLWIDLLCCYWGMVYFGLESSSKRSNPRGHQLSLDSTNSGMDYSMIIKSAMFVIIFRRLQVVILGPSID